MGADRRQWAPDKMGPCLSLSAGAVLYAGTANTATTTRARIPSNAGAPAGPNTVGGPTTSRARRTPGHQDGRARPGRETHQAPLRGGVLAGGRLRRPCAPATTGRRRRATRLVEESTARPLRRREGRRLPIRSAAATYQACPYAGHAAAVESSQRAKVAVTGGPMKILYSDPGTPVAQEEPRGGRRQSGLWPIVPPVSYDAVCCAD